MCQEVFKILQTMDLSKVEMRMALQCAPVITGIKESNLLIVHQRDERVIYRILNRTGIAYYCLLRQNENCTFLLFQEVQLIEYLQKTEVQGLLKAEGYDDLSMTGILRTFQQRYESYMYQRQYFPHEMGVLLGYPVEDVEGFIKNKGKNYLYAGYWKVYENIEEKKLLFEAYESAKEGMVLLLANGYEIRPLIEFFQDYGFCSFLHT